MRGPLPRTCGKVATPGRGNSSPTVWKDRIFLTTAYDGARRVALCFNRDNGKLLWESPAPEPREVERVYRKNTHATATPVTDGERVYALFGNSGLVAVDFHGKQLWHSSFGATSNYHGPGGSPLLYKDRIVFYQDQRANYLRRGGRRPNRQDVVEDAASGNSGLGHADRGSVGRPRRDHRQRSVRRASL